MAGVAAPVYGRGTIVVICVLVEVLADFIIVEAPPFPRGVDVDVCKRSALMQFCVDYIVRWESKKGETCAGKGEGRRQGCCCCCID